MAKRTAIIIGAGPAGLTAAYELCRRTDIKPVVLEATDMIGGLSRTVNYKGNRIDIGGHRFFSKSQRVMAWWQHILPIQTRPSLDEIALGEVPAVDGDTSMIVDPEQEDNVMLQRGRVSRIYFLRSFFDYPISLNWKTFSNLGLYRMVRIVAGFIKAQLFPRRPEQSLEDFFIDRFGTELYHTFFQDYTEKVWGMACTEIPAEWGAQRVKGLSVAELLANAWCRLLGKKQSWAKTETSLIEHFWYPKFGPGQLWEKVGDEISKQDGEIHLRETVIGLDWSDGIVRTVRTHDAEGKEHVYSADYVMSTMPIQDLIRAMGRGVPLSVGKVAAGLLYRDFITVGLLVRHLKIKNDTQKKTWHGLIPDNWIYIQEREVRLGRLQIFNNWSPYLVKDQDTVWLGLEYFCTAGDDLWQMPEAEFAHFAAGELEKIGIIAVADVLDSVVIHVPKAYPAYFGSYAQLGIVKDFLGDIVNLYLIGRNGMHRYNNMDHSMLTAMQAVDNILDGSKDKTAIWTVNTDTEYQEQGSLYQKK